MNFLFYNDLQTQTFGKAPIQAKVTSLLLPPITISYGPTFQIEGGHKLVLPSPFIKSDVFLKYSENNPSDLSSL